MWATRRPCTNFRGSVGECKAQSNIRSTMLWNVNDQQIGVQTGSDLYSPVHTRYIAFPNFRCPLLCLRSLQGIFVNKVFSPQGTLLLFVFFAATLCTGFSTRLPILHPLPLYYCFLLLCWSAWRIQTQPFLMPRNWATFPGIIYEIA